MASDGLAAGWERHCDAMEGEPSTIAADVEAAELAGRKAWRAASVYYRSHGDVWTVETAAEVDGWDNAHPDVCEAFYEGWAKAAAGE